MGMDYCHEDKDNSPCRNAFLVGKTVVPGKKIKRLFPALLKFLLLKTYNLPAYHGEDYIELVVDGDEVCLLALFNAAQAARLAKGPSRVKAGHMDGICQGDIDLLHQVFDAVYEPEGASRQGSLFRPGNAVFNPDLQFT